MHFILSQIFPPIIDETFSNKRILVKRYPFHYQSVHKMDGNTSDAKYVK